MENMESKIRYLEMIQGIIERMGSNSFMLKGWAVTLAVGIFALSSEDSDKLFFLLAYIPIILFWFIDTYYLQLEGKVDKFYCVSCLYFNKFNVLKDGRLYMCPVAAHSDIFNRSFRENLEISEGDFLDIYEIRSWEEAAQFSSSYVPFCRYCDLKRWGHHSSWKASGKKIEEYI